MTQHRQLTFEDVAPVEMDVLRQILAVEAAFHAELASTHATPATRTQHQHAGIACPLCHGHLTGSTCDKCGMESDL